MEELEDLKKQLKESAERRNEYRSVGDFEGVARENTTYTELTEKINDLEKVQIEIEDLEKQLKATAERRNEYRNVGDIEGVARENSEYTKLVVKINALKNPEKNKEQKNPLNAYAKKLAEELKTKGPDFDVSKKEDKKSESQTTEDKEENGISKYEIRKWLQQYKNKQVDMWQNGYADGEDITTDKDKKEFERINKITPALNSLLSKNAESEFISAEEIQDVINNYENKSKEIWREIVASGDSATAKESEELQKYSDIMNELKSILDLTKEKSKSDKQEQKETEDNKDFQSPSVVESDRDFQVPAPVEDTRDFQPPVLKMPQLDIKMNKKTGEVVLTEIGNADSREYTTYMDSYDYTRKGLKVWRNAIKDNEEIEEADEAYLKYVDPTIYNAYLEWDRANEDKNYSEKAATMYVNSVIQRQKSLDEGLKGIEQAEVHMPGNVKVDIGWHPRKRDARPEGENEAKGFKKLKYFLASHRANKILEHHDKPGFFRKNKMDLATVKDNRKLISTIGGTLAIAGMAHAIGSGEPEQPIDNKPKIIMEDDKSKEEGPENIAVPDQKIDIDTPVIEENQENITSPEQKQENNRIYPGDIVSLEEYAGLYSSADSQEISGAHGKTNQAVGVNKIAVVIDGKTISTVDHSADEIYKLAEDNGVEVNYHIDRVVSMNGKLCVQTTEVGNPSPVYVYNDNGVTRYSDGTEFKGDVKEGIGWIKQESATKANLQEQTVGNTNKETQTQARTVDQELDR